MAKHNPQVHPFSEPRENYTQVPNEYFEVHMKSITPSENLVLQWIIRKTRGWHKASEIISILQFMKATGIKSKNTVKTAIAGLVRKRFIFKYETCDGRPKRRKTYYWINTSKNAGIYESVVAGRMTAQEAYYLTGGMANGKPEVIHTAQQGARSNSDPMVGSKIDPSTTEPQGSAFDPLKKKPKEKSQKKDGDPLLKNVDKTSEAGADAVEQFREQRHIRRRRAEDPPGPFVAVGELVDQVLSSFPMPEPQ